MSLAVVSFAHKGTKLVVVFRSVRVLHPGTH